MQFAGMLSHVCLYPRRACPSLISSVSNSPGEVDEVELAVPHHLLPVGHALLDHDLEGEDGVAPGVVGEYQKKTDNEDVRLKRDRGEAGETNSCVLCVVCCVCVCFSSQ